MFVAYYYQDLTGLTYDSLKKCVFLDLFRSKTNYNDSILHTSFELIEEGP